MPRMTNFCVLPGEEDPHYIIRSVKEGIYIEYINSAQVVDLPGEEIVVVGAGACLIEDGHKTFPIRNPRLSTRGRETPLMARLRDW